MATTTLRPPSTSPSPSPTPGTGARNPAARASIGPSARLVSGNTPTSGLNPTSPRPTGIVGGRPTSELLGSGGMFQTPEAEAIDQWFENLQNYEATLEEMAAASLDVNFKEELSAIEQWFRVLSEAERTAALYSLLQHSTQVQIRFFITVLQQMARSDPMTALLSPGMGGSMQTQMEAKLNQMGLKSPNSANTRSFSNPQRQSLGIDSPNASSFLSPDTANLLSPGGPNNGSEAANTLAQQRAKLKANAAHRISAPAAAADGARGLWSGAGALGQLVEGTSSPSNDDGDNGPVPTSSGVRPKSTDFQGVANSFRSSAAAAAAGGPEEQLSPMVGGNWASMVNTPLVPMFNNNTKEEQTIDAAASRLANWSISNSNGGKMQLDDAKKYRRVSKAGSQAGTDSTTTAGGGGGVYDENGNLVLPNGPQPGSQRNGGGSRSVSGASQYLGAGGAGGGGGGGQWNAGSRSPSGFSNVSSNRFGGGSDDGSQLANAMPPGFGLGNGLGSPLAGYMGIPGMNMANMANMNMMGMMPADMQAQAQFLAAQMAAANGVFNPALFGMQAGAGMNMRNVRSSGGRSPGASKSVSGKTDKTSEEDVDPKLLDDIPGWLRSLRLHKYTPNFQGMHWKDMVVMDEAALEAKGVAALGARRKMLKTFELVRNKMGIEMTNPPAIPA